MTDGAPSGPAADSTGPLPVVGVSEFAPSFGAAAFAAEVMRSGDASGEVDKLIRAQLKGESAFRQRAYAEWPRFPDHPAAPALATLVRHQDGEDVDVSRVRGLSWLGKLLAIHAADWRGHENAVAARLRAAKDFPGCLFELEASFYLSGYGYSTAWLWPSAPDEGDVRLDGHVYVECVSTSPTLQIPRHLGVQLGSALLATMDRRRRDLLIEVRAEGALVAAHVPLIRDAVQRAVVDGVVGEVSLLIERYTARIEDLAPGGNAPPLEQLEDLWAEYARMPNKWGHIERDANGNPAHPRLVTLATASTDNTLAMTARAAARKHRQLKPNRENLVCVKFGLPVAIEQGANPYVLAEIRRIILASLESGNAHRVGGVLWFFEVGVLFPQPSRGIVDAETDRPGPAWMVLSVLNPNASVPLPEGF